MLNFRTAYLKAMRERAPKLFNELRRQGSMEAHLDAKAEEARLMFSKLTEDLPTLPSGALANLSKEREVTEIIYATLIEFPNERPESELAESTPQPRS